MEALSRFDERVLGDEVIGLLRERGRDYPETWKDPVRVARLTTLVKALYAARKLHHQEYVYFATMPVDSLVNDRVMKGSYERELGPINDQIRSLTEAHGLDTDAGEYWPLGEGPDEYRRLSERYDEVLDAKLLDTLQEFGLDDLVVLKKENPKEFNRLMERGRRSVFDRDEQAALRDLVVRCEMEAQKAASVGAYSSAVISLGSGVEGLLILRCLRSPHKAQRLASELPRSNRPRQPYDPMTWNFDQLIKVSLAAGWLPPVDGSFGTYSPPRLADLLRNMRNNVHPGRQARERPWVEVDERDYQDAHSIYVIILSALRIARAAASRKQKPED